MVRTVSGRVVNALTGAPVPRALVNLNSRAVLTDAQGKFSFPDFKEANGYTQVTKPGYSASPTPEANRQQKVTDLDALLELKLYPDAILTGTVTGPDGLPLGRTQVRLRRLTFDSTGPRWLSSGFAQTDVHGNYRFDTAAGRYRVATGYSPRSMERGEAVLPTSFPANTGEYLELANGEQREVNLRPRVGPAYPVAVSVVSTEGGENDRGLRLTASTPAGATFQLGPQRSADGFTVQLPAGNFTLRASTGERSDLLEGEVRVLVSERGTTQAVLHMAPEPIFPVEIAFELATAGDGSVLPSMPSAQQFNLMLHNEVSIGEGFDADSRLTILPDKTTQFQVAPGRYRLGGNLNGAWYIRSATNGVTDLMADDLAVAAGTAGSPIRLIVSNAAGRLKGSVTSSGQPASGWVYLIPEQPSLTPYFEVYIQPDGSFQWSGAPGKYLAVPSGKQVHEDFRDPAFLRKFSTAGREAVVASGAEATVDLSLAPEGVAR